MHRARQLLGERVVDHALAGDTRRACKCRTLDHDVEVALAARPGARMAVMARGIVLDLEPEGRERDCELVVDGIEYGAHLGDLQFLKGNISASYLAHARRVSIQAALRGYPRPPARRG